MADIIWKRALDDVDTVKDKWLSYNPLFKSYVPYFDEAFDRGIPLNLAQYVTRPLESGGTFEEDMCRLLFSTHRNPTGKVYILQGTVGSGKTCLVRYLIHNLIPRIIPGALAIYVDAWNIFFQERREEEALEATFLEAVEITVTGEIQ